MMCRRCFIIWGEGEWRVGMHVVPQFVNSACRITGLSTIALAKVGSLPKGDERIVRKNYTTARQIRNEEANVLRGLVISKLGIRGYPFSRYNFKLKE